MKERKQIVKLNESQLRQVIKKSIKVLKEGKKSTFLYFVCDKYTNSCLGHVFMSKEDAQRYINELITKYPEWSDRYKVISLPREDFEVISNEDMKESKQTIKLNESQLRQIIKESIKNALNEEKTDWDISWEQENEMWEDYAGEHMSNIKWALEDAKGLLAKTTRNGDEFNSTPKYLDRNKRYVLQDLIRALDSAVYCIRKLSNNPNCML